VTQVRTRAGFWDDALVADVVTGEGACFGVLCLRLEGRWQVELLPERITEDVDTLLAATRGQPEGAAAIVFANIADDFFVAARRRGVDDLLLLSDATAGAVDDLAGSVCRRLGVEIPDEDTEDVWPVGDLDMFDDLGLNAGELGTILADIDAYADEQLLTVARELGFDEAFSQVVDVLVR
jgi:putative tRNA adenosine deaminase-associated protein